METVDLVALHMVVGGEALARESSGRVVFVSGAIAGETVRAELTAAKKDFARATVTEVLVASPDRVTPACEAWHRGCGGCDWQHIEPAAQLAHKTAIVTEALSRTARLADPVVVAAGSVEPWGYRTTVRLAHSACGLGFRSRHSHAVVPIAECPVADSAVNAALAAMGTVAGSSGDVTIRVSTATGATNTSGSDADIEQDIEQHIEEDVAGRRLRVSIDSFFQSSPQAADLLVAAVGRALADVDLPNARVIDAYGGIGLFAATAAAAAGEVVVVEGSTSACADARHNLSGRNATVIHGRVEAWEPTAADVVIADPARAGLDRDAVAVLVATGAPRIVLVSCDTGSLARDTKLLVASGYQHRSTEVIDAFPNTSHIETVTRFDQVVAG